MNLLDIFCSVNNAPPPHTHTYTHTCSNENFELIISHIHQCVCVCVCVCVGGWVSGELTEKIQCYFQKKTAYIKMMLQQMWRKNGR